MIYVKVTEHTTVVSVTAKLVIKSLFAAEESVIVLVEDKSTKFIGLMSST